MVNLSAQLWQQALDLLKNDIDEESYVTWLSPTNFIGFDKNTLYISVPSEFYRSWIISNYEDKIKQSLADLGAADCLLKFEVGERGATNDKDVQSTVSPNSRNGYSTFFSTTTFTGLNEKYTFDNFVVGESNRFANAVTQSVADPQSTAYNPLFLYGGVGLGKTHLMQAVGHRYLQKSPNAVVRYVTSEQFMTSFIDAITSGKQPQFRNFVRNSDLLLIDDVQFLLGKERTQTEFFHTFNALYDSGKKIVISSDRPPKELDRLEERLRNRFEWGLIIDIQPPELETRIAILKKKSESAGINLPNDVALFVAERIHGNVRQLEGVVLRLKAYALFHQQAIAVDMAKNVVGHLLQEEAKDRATIGDIQNAVCDYFAISVAELVGDSRKKKFSEPRHIAMYLAKKISNQSFPEIASKFGGKDHTTVIHAFRKVEERMESDSSFKNLIFYLTRKLDEESK